jgi:hypothetical protein
VFRFRGHQEQRAHCFAISELRPELLPEYQLPESGLIFCPTLLHRVQADRVDTIEFSRQSNAARKDVYGETFRSESIE